MSVKEAPQPLAPPGTGDGIEAYTVVGRDVERVDAREKVSGRAEYVADLSLPGMLWGAVLRSPYAHARIKSIDTSQARKLRGVWAVVTAEQTPKKSWGAFIRDMPIMAID